MSHEPTDELSKAIAMGIETTSPPLPELVSAPIPAAIAAVFHEGRILLVRRANPPDAGHWGFPGGKIETGESVESAAVRELLEETGVQAEALRAFTAVDAFDRDDQGRLRRHFILIGVFCTWISGEPVAGDDALEARWFRLEELDGAGLALSLNVVEVAREAEALSLKVTSERHASARD